MGMFDFLKEKKELEKQPEKQYIHFLELKKFPKLKQEELRAVFYQHGNSRSKEIDGRIFPGDFTSLFICNKICKLFTISDFCTTSDSAECLSKLYESHGYETHYYCITAEMSGVYVYKQINDIRYIISNSQDIIDIYIHDLVNKGYEITTNVINGVGIEIIFQKNAEKPYKKNTEKPFYLFSQWKQERPFFFATVKEYGNHIDVDLLDSNYSIAKILDNYAVTFLKNYLMKETIGRATRDSIKSGNITDVAFNFTDELDGGQYKLIYSIRNNSHDYDSEDVCNKIIDGVSVRYGKFESLNEFLNYYPDFKLHLISNGYPDIEKTGISIAMQNCGNTKLISADKQYYQFPIENECPILVRGVSYFDDQQKELIYFLTSQT